MKRFILCSLACLFSFSGCQRCAKKLQRTFKQAKKCKQCCINDARDWVRGEAVRDGLATIDHIYVLPLVPLVNQVHDCMLNCYCFDDPEERKAPLKGCAGRSEASRRGSGRSDAVKQPEKMTCIVLTDRTRDDWNMVLKVAGKVYRAEKIKNIDVDRAYKKIFGDWIVAVKQNAYEVIFNLAPLNDESSFTLQLCDGIYTVNFCWGANCEDKRSCWEHSCKECK